MTDIDTYTALGEAAHDGGRRPQLIAAETTLYQPKDPEPYKELFRKYMEGYWVLNSVDDWQNATVIRLYIDENATISTTADGVPVIYKGLFRAKFYAGLQDAIRELQQTDTAISSGKYVNIPTSYDQSGVQAICEAEWRPNTTTGTYALTLYNIRPILSTDQLHSTFTVVARNGVYDTANVYLWSDWDGTSDNPSVGLVETLMQYKKVTTGVDLSSDSFLSSYLAGGLAIQYNSDAITQDWKNPLNLFDYLRNYHLLMGQPQKIVDGVTTVGSESIGAWAGAAKEMEIYSAILGAGISVGPYNLSSSIRGGKPLAVWKTRNAAKYPVTTFHTTGPHAIMPGARVELSGFKVGSPYSVFNGMTLNVAGWPPANITDKYLLDSQLKPKSWEYYFNAAYDSSGLPDFDYARDVGLGNVITVKILDPIKLTADSGYGDFLAAVLYYTTRVYYAHTHTRYYYWVDSKTMAVPTSFADLKSSIALGKAMEVRINTRNFLSNSYALYWNPYVITGGSVRYPVANVNDPFGIFYQNLSGNFKTDIPLENYLIAEKTYNMFFTVSGPILDGSSTVGGRNEPITGLLKAAGYTSNGSILRYAVAPFGSTPANLVDEYGSHPYMLYAAADGGKAQTNYSQYSFFGGIVRPELTGGNANVAYIRIGSEDGLDAPLYYIGTRPLAFVDPSGKVPSGMYSWLGAWALLIRQLKSLGAKKFIIDNRNNAGGFLQCAQVIASLIGDDRFAYKKAMALAGSTTSASNGSFEINPSVLTAGGATMSETDSNARLINCKATLASFGGDTSYTIRDADIVFLNGIDAASGGDIIPHMFTGPATGPSSYLTKGFHDLGAGVRLKFVGDVDGRLASGVKQYDNPPRDASGQPRALGFTTEAGVSLTDRNGPMARPQPAVMPFPADLLSGWYDDTVWKDLGYISLPTNSWKLGNLKGAPSPNNKSSWRDSWLEHAIWRVLNFTA